MLVIIDGECSFCQWASRLLRRLCVNELEIVALSQVKSEVINQWSMDPLWSIDSIKVISQHQLFIKSEAISVIMKQARWYAQPLRIVFILPVRLLDMGYDWVARNRKSLQCEI